jgi:hypothetical protein
MKAGTGQTSAKRVEIRGNDEFADLARGYNGMADAIEQQGKLLATAEQEKGDLLRNMYPSGLAERVCNGAEVTAETVSNVTVAVALIDGLDMLTVNRSAPEVRNILNALLAALNSTAITQGVEPVRSLGESYVVLSVSNPGLVAGPRDEFLSKFWYLAQRRGLRLDPSPGPDAATRLGMLEQGGAFRRDADALPQLAQASVFRRYRRGDVLLRAGRSAPDVFFVVAGQLAVTIPTGEGGIRLELLRSWELTNGTPGDAGRRLQPRSSGGGT